MRRGASRGSARGPMWLAAYGVCLLLVMSFILFEVLDVDGSDFPSPIRSATVLKMADPVQDVRRVPLQSAPPVNGLAIFDPSHAGMLPLQRRVDDAGVDRPAHPSLRRALRHMLARGLLAEPAPSA